METIGIFAVIAAVIVVAFLSFNSEKKIQRPDQQQSPHQDHELARQYVLEQVPAQIDVFIIALHDTMSKREEYEAILEIDYVCWDETLNVVAAFIFSHLLVGMNSVSESTKSKVATTYLDYVRSKYPTSGKLYDEFAKFIEGAPRPPQGFPSNLDSFVVLWMFKTLFQHPVDIEDDALFRIANDIHSVMYRVIGEQMGLEYVPS